MTDERQTQYLSEREQEIATRLNESRPDWKFEGDYAINTNVAAVSRFIRHVHEDQAYLLDTVARLREALTGMKCEYVTTGRVRSERLQQAEAALSATEEKQNGEN